MLGIVSKFFSSNQRYKVSYYFVLQVLATHTYKAEDEDELAFEAGEIINIIECEDPDDQDEGWLMGVSTTTGKKGLFPENFTRKIIKRNSAKPAS